MKNFTQTGDTLKVTAPADVLSGALVVVGSIVGVAATDALEDADVEVDVVGCFDLPKVTLDDVGQGDKLYWDSSVSKLTKTAGSGSKPLVGVATAGTTATVVNCRLQSTAATGPA